ncbi:MAG: SAM-dependent methyltransferase [Marinilabiliales bacterium]|nr:MAG: SAM-dependent methyltransferase [Marinilabiliales bacterium]
MYRFIEAWVFRKWYWYISKIDRRKEILFMNFGYHDDNEKTELSEEDEKNRFSIQLYYKLASFAGLAGKNICEIGCGRGGGLSFLHKTFKPASSTGLDLNQKAVDFCNGHYRKEGLTFIQGNAQELPFENDTFDIVLNVESSHRYLLFSKFLSEVHRTLKSGGYLLLTDFRHDHKMAEMKEDISNSEFDVVHYELINENIVKALKADDERRRDLVKRLIPRGLRSTALNFAGATGSTTYKRYKSGRYLYFIYVLRK